MTVEQLVESIERQIAFIQNTTIAEAEEKYEKALKIAATFEEKDALRKAHEATLDIHNSKIRMLRGQITIAHNTQRGKTV